MLEQQSPEEWEQGLSSVEMRPDGNIMAVRGSKLLPVVEDEDEEVYTSCIYINT